jgi:hypothetical protein
MAEIPSVAVAERAPAGATPSTPVTADDFRVEARVRLNLSLRRSTHLLVKVWCARRGETLQGGLERLIDRAFANVATSTTSPNPPTSITVTSPTTSPASPTFTPGAAPTREASPTSEIK